MIFVRLDCCKSAAWGAVKVKGWKGEKMADALLKVKGWKGEKMANALLKVKRWKGEKVKKWLTPF